MSHVTLKKIFIMFTHLYNMKSINYYHDEYLYRGLKSMRVCRYVDMYGGAMRKLLLFWIIFLTRNFSIEIIINILIVINNFES